MKLRDLEQRLKDNGQAKESVAFYASDGAAISKSTLVAHLLHTPYFVMKLD